LQSLSLLRCLLAGQHPLSQCKLLELNKESLDDRT